MNLLAAWVLFPAVLALVSGGGGLLVDRITGRLLPGALVLPVGFAFTLVLADLLTWRTHALALPVTLALAVAGLLLGRPRPRPGALDRWAAVAAVAVFLSFGAPAFLSGNPTFSGSLALPDTSNQLVLASQLAHDGRQFAAEPQSSFRTSAAKYLETQYPVAAQGALGVLSPLGAQPIIWLYQSFLSFAMAMACLAFFWLLQPLIRRSAYRAAASFVVSQPALTYAYVQQGSIKETAGVAMVAATFATSIGAISKPSARALIPPALCAAGLFGALGPTAFIYVAVPLLLAVVAWGRSVARPRELGRGQLGLAAVAVAAAAVAAVALLPSIRTAYTVASKTLSLQHDLGNLAAPLKISIAGGVWLGGDFRYAQQYPTLGVILAIGVGLAAVFGLLSMARTRAFGPGLLVGGVLVVSLYLLTRGSPYADAKVLMIASPAVLVAAVAGLAWLGRARGRLVLVAAIPLGLGVLGSNALAYHEVQRAPFHRYEELRTINGRFAGTGPALLSEYDEYAGYLLRDVQIQAEPESLLEYRGPPARHPDGLKDRRHRPSVKSAFDIEDLSTRYVQSMRLLVLRRSPNTSRPPADFKRVYRGRYYDVWRRQPGPRVVAHFALGPNAFTPAGVPSCAEVRRLGRRARAARARLAYVTRPALLGTDSFANGVDVPKGWFEYGAYPRALVPAGPGRLTRFVALPVGGAYHVWIEGSFGRRIHVSVDGHRAGAVSYEAGNPGQYFPLGRLRLSPGRHRVVVERGGGDLRPGDGGGFRSSLQHIGPVVFSPVANERTRVQTISPARATDLCGRRLDWIEIVRG